jgi:periplasmic protein TonB
MSSMVWSETAFSGSPVAVRKASPLAWVAVVGLHAAAVAGLMQAAPMLMPADEPPVVMVSLTQPMQEQPAQREAPQPPAKPVQRSLPATPPAPAPKPVRSAAPAPVLAAQNTQAATPEAVRAMEPSKPAAPSAEVAAKPAPAVVAEASPKAAQAVAQTVPQAVTAPRFDADYLDNPSPAYPPLSRREGEEGTVMLSVYVEANGQAGKVELARSSGFERLDRAALAAVKRWRFVPARRGSDAVADWVRVPIVFSLKE